MGQQSWWWNLSSGIRGSLILRKQTQDTETYRPASGLALVRLSRPLQSQLSGDERSSLLFGKFCELVQQLATLFQLESEGTPDRQILYDGFPQYAHIHLQGHGCAIARKAARSAFA